jgi:two-component system phosphate regulon sensor histidine kinase PhoR
MMRRSFLWRLFTGYAVLVALVAVVFISTVTPGVRGAYEADTEASLASQVTLLTEFALPTLLEVDRAGLSGPAALESPGVRALQNQLVNAGEASRTRLTVVLNDGTVVADSAEDPAVMANHANRPELRRAGQTGYGRSIRYSRTLGFRLMYVAEPVLADGRQIGIVRTSVPLDEIDARIFELLQRVVFSAVLALVVALLLGWLVGRRITLPLRRVSAAVQDLERGDYSHRITVDSEDEIGALASTINHLGESLGARIAQVRSDRNKTLSILASMTEGVIAVDAEERIVHLNTAAAEMLQIEADDSIGMHVWEAVRVSAICTLITRVVDARQPDALRGRRGRRRRARHARRDRAASTRESAHGVRKQCVA